MIEFPKRGSYGPATSCYELAATASPEGVQIFGESLREIVQIHYRFINRAKSADRRALEKGTLALLLSEQLENFALPLRYIHKAMSLFEEAITSLRSLESRETTKYYHLIKQYEDRHSELTRLIREYERMSKKENHRSSPVVSRL